MISINQRNVQRLQKYRVKDSLERWQLISEKRYDGYSHLQEDDHYNEAQNPFFNISKIQNPNPGRWKAERIVGPDGGSLYVNFSGV